MKFYSFFLSAFLVLQMTNSLPSPIDGIPTVPDFSEAEHLQGKVRDKRKSEIEVPAPVLPEVSALVPPPIPGQLSIKEVTKVVPVPAEEVKKPIEAVAKTLQADKSITPENTPTLTDQDSVAERVKKQAIKVPCTSKTVCGLPTNSEQRLNQEVVLINRDDFAKSQPTGEGKQYLKQSRTIDPIYSFGPVSVNSNAGYGHDSSSYGHNSGSYGHTYNYAIPARPVLAQSSGYSSQAAYSSPGGGLSYNVVMPYAAPVPHRPPPVAQHSFTISHAPIEIKPVVYYEAPEPIVVDNHHSSHHEDIIHSSHAEDSYAVHDANPVSLYCQTMKSKDLAKTLSSGVKGKSNESTDDTLEHIQRVNEIKDQITELNAAAQKLVDQQEQMYRAQQESMIPQNQEYQMRNAEPMMMRSMDPLTMMRTHPRMPPYSPYMYHNSYLRPMFREAEEPVMTEDSKKEEEKPKPKAEEKPKPKEDAKPKEDSKLKAKEDTLKEEQAKNDVSDQEETKRPYPNMRQWYPDYSSYYPSEHTRHYGQSYGGYYRSAPEVYQPTGYRTYPAVYGTEFMPYQRSETGFPTSPLFAMRSQPETPYRGAPEDAIFMQQLLDMGKKMGIISNDYQATKKSEEKDKEEGLATRSEGVLDDLRFGDQQKPKRNQNDESTSVDMNPVKSQPDQPAKKKDKRGLIHPKN